MLIFRMLIVTIILFSCSVAAANTPSIMIQCKDSTNIYKADVADILENHLMDQFVDSNNFIVNKYTDNFDELEVKDINTDYILQCNIVGLGPDTSSGNGIGIGIGTGRHHSDASVILSSVNNLSIGGMIYANRSLFIALVDVKVIRTADNKTMYSKRRMSRTRIRTLTSVNNSLINDALLDVAKVISKPLIKDVSKSKRKIFIEANDENSHGR